MCPAFSSRERLDWIVRSEHRPMPARVRLPIDAQSFDRAKRRIDASVWMSRAFSLGSSWT